MSDRITAGGHVRVRPFNTADTYPEQQLGNDLCQAVIAGNTVYLRGQVAQDLDTRESVAIGDPARQAEKVMDNIELLLVASAASELAHITTLPRVPDRHPVPRGGLPGARASGWRASSRSSPGSSCPRWRGPSGSSR